MAQKLDGFIIDRYRLTQHLARGGMADIYLAEEMATGQAIAVKLVQNNDEHYSKRFRREVRVIAELKHEHILPALDWGEYDTWCYLAMPYMQYGTLSHRLAEKPLTLEEAGEILDQLAGALACAHAHGLVHRDIKPSNILMQDETYVYLADFGLAKNAGADRSLTETEFLIGTPEYMAPDLVDGPATIASDIYSLGIVLYEMLTGHVPFKAQTPVATIWKHLQEPPTPPSSLNPAIPYEIEQVVLRALEKDPAQRYQSAQEFQQAYQHALTMKDKAERIVSDLAAVQVEHIPLASQPPPIPSVLKTTGPQKVACTALLTILLLALPLLAFSPGTTQSHANPPGNRHQVIVQTATPSPTTKPVPLVSHSATPTPTRPATPQAQPTNTGSHGGGHHHNHGHGHGNGH